MKISVIIPTWNEVNNIGLLVKYINDHAANAIAETIVVDAGSQDNTAVTATDAGAKVVCCPHKSRAMQMNVGAKYATGELLYFIHADIKLIPSFANDILQAVEEGFDSGCYRYVFDSDRRILRINGYFTRFDRIMCRGGDQTLFVTKTVFERLGGFNEYFTIMEDYDFIIRIRKQYSFKIIPKNIVVSARKYETNSWIRVQLANLTVFIMFFLKRPPEQMRAVYTKLLDYRR
jgi:rSAM/selenodomain-associated transferase 2